MGQEHAAKELVHLVEALSEDGRRRLVAASILSADKLDAVRSGVSKASTPVEALAGRPLGRLGSPVAGRADRIAAGSRGCSPVRTGGVRR